MASNKSVKLLFSERMKRERRYDEFVKRVNAAMEETGKTWMGAVWPVMREMGYEGPNQERALYQEYLEAQSKKACQGQIQAERDEIRRERIRENFEMALASLPDSASVGAEMDWIRAHPAMIRLSRQNNPSKQVVISADDILSPAHGRAPSKSAVAALQHWANHPAEFFKQMLSEHKKKQEDQAAQYREVDEDLDEIESLLKEIKREY